MADSCGKEKTHTCVTANLHVGLSPGSAGSVSFFLHCFGREPFRMWHGFFTGSPFCKCPTNTANAWMETRSTFSSQSLTISFWIDLLTDYIGCLRSRYQDFTPVQDHDLNVLARDQDQLVFKIKAKNSTPRSWEHSQNRRDRHGSWNLRS